MMNEEIILNLINEGKSVEEIGSILNISRNTLYHYLIKLKNKGYSFLSKYYINGNIDYQLIKTLNYDNEYNLITDKESNEIKLMVISDLHLGSLYEDRRLIESIYNYCINNDIHVILNIGDFVEGDVNSSNIKVLPNKQIEHALKYHPYSEEIFNFLILGNHDYSLLSKYGINILDVIKNKRWDIIPIGFGEGKINIKIRNQK